MQQYPELLTIEETASYLRVHRSTISRMIHAGELYAIHVKSRKLIHKQDLKKFIENQRLVLPAGGRLTGD